MKITGTIYLYEDSYYNDKLVSDMTNEEKAAMVKDMERRHGGRCIIVGDNDEYDYGHNVNHNSYE